MFDNLDIPIPNVVYSYDHAKQKEIYHYLLELTNNEQLKKAYMIAYDHLGTSFNIFKSNGYKDWKSKQC